MVHVFEKVRHWGHELGEFVDRAPALGGSFLASAIRDTMVRHLNEFSGTDVVPYIAYRASQMSIETLSMRLSLIGSTLRQISHGLLLGALAIGGTDDVAAVVALGCIRGIRKVMRHELVDVPLTYVVDVIEGLVSVTEQVLEDRRVQGLLQKCMVSDAEPIISADGVAYV